MQVSPSQATVRRIEQNSGTLATRSVARMDEELAWFRRLPPDQRSWVTLVAQAGIASFVEWLRSPDEVLRLTGEVFGTAPRELARRVSLQQTVELVRLTIAVVEEQVPRLADPGDEEAVADAVLRFSREIAFAAARVYASAAEARGAWDARLEALVIDGLVRGVDVDESGSPLTQLAALGWRSEGALTAVAGSPPAGRSAVDTIDAVHRAARRAGYDVLAGVHGGRLLVLLGGIGGRNADRAEDGIEAAGALLEEFGPGPVVVGGLAGQLAEAGRLTAVALSGLRSVGGWPAAPRPVSADDLLPERTIAGDAGARLQLIDTVYRPLAEADLAVLETVVSYLEHGRSLEATARALFVHANTVRYRLRRVAELCGQAPTEARGAFAIQLALVAGRLHAAS
ncbi:helix-turn-helix domain-containing protein [Jatrophihabitans telluris]|uniref:Helix-turn-helix domain-containing protein n=1 Tax=Jatrophihabitans telluris TaxID=2038343 RepID=A0ABY4QVH3_9ACTN|nr:helix-turn-helix domain-containing protein [Jatrophihabitans telluris]UQX87313.1 helix-turn-helix domain-containing protein [Jatrophihabitans telluris]